MSFNEKNLELAIAKALENEGYEHVNGETMERRADDILISRDLIMYLRSRYPDITEMEMQRVPLTFATTDRGDYVNNRTTLRNIIEGFSLMRDDMSSYLWIELIDFEHPENNIFKFVNQYKIQTGNVPRIPDGIIFVNGIPLVIIEFKTAVREEATMENAYKQITTRYIRDIPEIFTYNAFTVISEGVNSMIGTAFTDYSNYYSWNKVDAEDPQSSGVSSLYTLINGVFRKERLLRIFHDFIYFPDDDNSNLKIVCRYPQYFGATKLLESIKAHMRPGGDGRGGTYFGTTGCGKSYTMLFLTRLLMRSKDLGNPTIIILTDRNNLDHQLHSQFAVSKTFIGDMNIHSVKNGAQLRIILKNVSSGGVYLATIQKFNEEGLLLSDRPNIVIISDEAHRTQLNMEEADKVVNGRRKHSIGFAAILRQSFPNATYVGFTGTPIDATMEVFGDIVDEYTMVESEKDKITSKIVYEGRAAKVKLSDDQLTAIEKYYHDSEDHGANPYQVQRSKKDLAKMEVIIGNHRRLDNVAEDFIHHYEVRVEEGSTVCGKCMFVCAKRWIAFEFYKLLKEKRPQWFEVRKLEDTQGPTVNPARPIEMVNLVATRGKDDPRDLYDLCGNDEYRADLEVQFKKKESNFKIAIVVDMWLTGFDVPFLDAIYLDKPIQKHSLIQAISRVNRIYKGKDYGLVVDYLGIRPELNKALNLYSNGKMNKDESIRDTLEFVKVVKEYLDILDARFYGFDSHDYYSNDEEIQLKCLGRAMEFVQQNTEFETVFMNTSRKLKTAYNQCTYSDKITKAERDKIYFYCGVRSMVAKVKNGDVPDATIMNRNVRKLLEKAILSDRVIQLCTQMEEMERGRVNILSDEYLEKLKRLPEGCSKFNLLKRLARLKINMVAKVNKLQADKFSERFRKIVDKYNDRHLRVENIKEIIDSVTEDIITMLNNEIVVLIEDIQVNSDTCSELGLTESEKAFYDILEHTIKIFEFEFDIETLPDMAKVLKIVTDEACSVLDWQTKQDVKDDLKMKIAITMQRFKFPPEYLEGVYDEIFRQMENYKRNSE